MSGSELYLGHAVQGVDDKGRVAIPSDFRPAFEANSAAREIFIIRDRARGCLVASDKGWFEEHHQRLQERDHAIVVGGGQPDPAAKTIFGNPERAVFDGNGRFILPAFSKLKAGIERWAFFHGAGRTFDIWAPEVLMASEHADEEARELCEFALSQKKVKL